MGRREGEGEHLKKPQSNRPTRIWITVLLLSFLLINYFTFSQKPKEYPNYVSDSPSPTGVKAVYTYFNKEMESKRWVSSPKMLPKDSDKLVLVMIEPTFILDKNEMKAYTDFLESGNTILLFQNNPKGMFDIKTEPAKDDGSTNKKVYDSYHSIYKAEISSTIRLLPKNDDEILLYDDAGPISLKRLFGKGQLIVTIAPQWMTNGKLLNQEHLPLVLHLMNASNGHRVLFDEYIHGDQNASNMLMIYPKWFLTFMLQGSLISILWLWYKGMRFGPIFFPREDSVRFSDEGIRALTAWYLRGSRYHDSIVIQADYVKNLLQERWGIPSSWEWLDLASLFERKLHQMPTSEIGPFLDSLAYVLEKEKLNKLEYLLWSRKLDRLRKEVEQG